MRGQNFSFEVLCKKVVTEVKMHKSLVCAYKSQDFAQSQKNFAQLHDREIVTFRKSAQFQDKSLIRFLVLWPLLDLKQSEGTVQKI